MKYKSQHMSIVLVDDGSTDRTLEVIQGLGDTDRHVYATVLFQGSLRKRQPCMQGSAMHMGIMQHADIANHMDAAQLEGL